MKTLIIYATRYGCTEKCSIKLAENLGNDETEILNIKESNKINLDLYETVIIGGSIIAGKIDSNLEKYIEDNFDRLLKKKLGIFICAGIEEKAAEELKSNFPAELISHASAVGYFGYEFSMEKMNFAIRALVKKMTKVSESISKILEENILKFAQEIKKS